MFTSRRRQFDSLAGMIRRIQKKKLRIGPLSLVGDVWRLRDLN